MQSSIASPSSSCHVAVVMDGNGRWAARRGLPRTAGHHAGARAVRPIVEAAPRLGVTMLTLYALSSDNLSRPPREVAALLRLLADYLGREAPRLAERGVRLQVVGRRDRLPARLLAAIDEAERRTAGGRALHLRIAVDYSARGEIRRALADAPADGQFPLDAWPDVDLVVRAGGERRLSDFLLWECAYAELWFSDRLWPDFTPRDLEEAMAEYRRRDRRFGLVSGVPAA